MLNDFATKFIKNTKDFKRNDYWVSRAGLGIYFVKIVRINLPQILCYIL